MKPRRFFLFTIIAVLLVLALGAAGTAWVLADLPAVDSLPQRLHTPSMRIVDRNGRLLYEVLDQQSGRNAVLPLDAIPLALRQATIATEDQSFYTNPGVDWRGVLRSIWINLRGGETLAGGSTITQQVARNLLMEQGERSERRLQRKLREADLAWQLTRQLSKDEILALYLNQTYYGGMAYGVEAAAQTFFGKPVAELDLAESALIAGLPQAPSLYNPFTNPQAARERQQVVLGLMVKHGDITAEQQVLAEREPLVFAETPYPIEAPHFVMMVRAALDELLTPEQVYQHGGVVVRTTLNLDWQFLAESAVTHQLKILETSEDGLGHNVNSAALVALDPHNGEVLALVGSPDYFDAQIAGAINMALSPRQPGSALKPLIYATALDPHRSGIPWTAATLILDVRTPFLTREGQAYTPENYDMRQHGPVLVRQALASSLNIPAVLTLNHIGMQSLFELAGNLGISTLKNPADYDLSLALGGGEVRLYDLTAAYAAFANGGYRVQPHTILEISDFQGNVLYQAEEARPVRVLDERVAWLISDILSDNDARRLGFGANSILRLDRPAAVKTGTTSNFHDNWTVGYTPSLVVGVWSGNTNYESMRGVNGLSGAAPIWHQFVRSVLSGQSPEEFTRPAGLVHLEICALSGLLPTPACPYRRWEWFIDGTQPVEEDHFYRQVTLDAATGRLADASTPVERRVSQVVLDLPPELRPWARSQGLVLLADLQSPAATGANSQAASLTPLKIVSPAGGSLYLLATGFASNAQRILIEAIAAPGVQQVSLWLDGSQVASFSSAPYQFWWTLAAGEHRIWAQAVLSDGRQIKSDEVSFVVKN
jgi:penicillin-binding protein 1C